MKNRRGQAPAHDPAYRHRTGRRGTSRTGDPHPAGLLSHLQPRDRGRGLPEAGEPSGDRIFQTAWGDRLHRKTARPDRAGRGGGRLGRQSCAGVALAARRAGIRATIVMPESASLPKQEATAAYGGEILLAGQNISECLQQAELLVQQGKVLIHPFDDSDIIAGQGTIGLEVLQDCPDVDTVFVPIGGGGLISGIASAVKALRPQTRVIGVQAAACPSAPRPSRRGGPAGSRPNALWPTALP